MKKILLSLFILFIPCCLYAGGVLFTAGGVESGGGFISEVTLNNSTPDAWDACTGAEGNSEQNDTKNADSQRVDISNDIRRWYFWKGTVFGPGANQIPSGTTASQINDATLTIIIYSNRYGESGDVLQVSAVTELYSWQLENDDPIPGPDTDFDGISFLGRNTTTGTKSGIPGQTGWTAGNLDDSLAGSNTISFGDSGWTTSSIVVDIIDIVKYWCDNSTTSESFTFTLTTDIGAAFEFFHTDSASPPSILINDGL